MTRTRSLIIGIVPKFQRSGIDAAIFWHLRPVMYRKPWFTEMELSWAGDFNPKIVALYESCLLYTSYSYSMDITNPDLPDRFWKIAEWVSQKPEYSYEHFRFKDQDKFIADFVEIHGQAWSGHSNYKPASSVELKEMLAQARFILDRCV